MAQGRGRAERRSDAVRRDGDGGFTLVELVISVALAAFLFTTLASVMYASLRTLGVQKSRTRANDLTTVGIEDLQRLSYNSLGLCAAPPGPVPPDMGDTVLLPNCGGSPPPVKHGPCQPGPAPAGAVPNEAYTCVDRDVTYTVRRFVAYGNVAHTEKRMAVLTEWTDQGGQHRVAQQSALRIPSQNAVVGLAPPALDDAGTHVAPNSTGLSGDTNDTDLSLTATTTGLDSTQGDTVVAVFETVDTAGRQQHSVSLIANATSTVWTGVLAAGAARMGPGTQYVVFTATRQADGKVNSLVKTPALTVTGAAPFPPTVTVTGQPPPTVDIDAEGDLTGSVVVEAGTTDVSPADEVSMTFETQTGAVSVAMSPVTVIGTCTGISPDVCQITWRATINPSSGFHFLPSPPTRRFYITAKQVPAGGLYAVDSGATAAVATNAVTFT